MIRAAVGVMICTSLAAAFPVPRPAQGPAVEGSVWKGPIQWTNYQLLEQTVTFHADGKVTMKYKEFPTTDYTGTWKQDGDKLTWEFPGKSTYEVKIVGDRFEGTARNESNMTATHSGTREPPK